MIREILSKENFKRLGCHCWKFIQRFCCTAFIYIMGGGGISYIVATLVPLGLKAIGIPTNFCMIIMKILLTIAPMFGALGAALAKEEDRRNEFSMDLCFAAWLLTIIVAWMFL